MSAPSVDVVDRLEELAAHAPAAPVDADALWVRGRRRQARGWAAVAATATVFGLVGAMVLPGLAGGTRTVAPADPDSAAVLPDGLRQPGGWDPVLGQATGRLSAIGIGEDYSWRTMSRTGPWWAVSATTGESGFLDLPELADVAETPALSADGRLLAYWSTGQVDGDPVVNGVKYDESEDSAPVVGVAVIDLESGTRQVWEIPSTHGLFTGGMAWAGDELWWWAGPTREVNGTFGGEPLRHTWDVRTGVRDAFAEDSGTPVGFSASGDAPGGFVAMVGPRRLRWVTATGVTTVRLVLPAAIPDGATLSDLAMSTDGSRVAVLVPPDPTHYDDLQPVLVGEVVDGVARLTAVDDAETRDIAGWRSPTEVVVLEDSGPRDGRAPQALAAWTVDVTTGERNRLIDLEVDNTPTVAAGAWAAPVMDAPRSWSPPDPGLVGAGSTVLIVFCISLWRSLRRRRGHP